jgi:CDP-diacylglycerol pyrophosphatase
LLVVVLLLGVPHSAKTAVFEYQTLPRDALWHVIEMCEGFVRATGTPLPCLKIHPRSNDSPGYAVVPVPRAIGVLLVPTERISGIEASQLLDPDHPNWWRLAWQQRTLVMESGSGLSRNDMALGVNSKRARSQDQLHIHIGCAKGSLVKKIQPFERSIRKEWSPFPIPLDSESWMAMRLVEEDLTTNPFVLLLEIHREHAGLAEWGMGILPWTFSDGSNGFLLFANGGRGFNETGSGAKFVDAECRDN